MKMPEYYAAGWGEQIAKNQQNLKLLDQIKNKKVEVVQIFARYSAVPLEETNQNTGKLKGAAK